MERDVQIMVESVVTNYVTPYLDGREREWKKIVSIQKMWNWTFAILFTLMLLTLCFVAISFKELNQVQRAEIEYQHGITEQKKQQDAELAKEYRKNMEDWKNDNGKTKVVR
jgi:hypothetical protein